MEELKFFIRRWRSGDRRALSLALSWAEGHWLEVITEPSLMAPFTIGVTGLPGVGKSTLLARLVTSWRQRRKEPTAVLAVDPTSVRSGGAFLGDRIRMQDLTDDPDVFIRSLTNRARPGGISVTAWAMAKVLRAFGFSTVFLETVGVGQSEVEVTAFADQVLLVLSPDYSDVIQWLKGGVLETADAVVVNKSDLDPKRTQLLCHELPYWLKRNAPVFVTVALMGEGVDELVTFLETRDKGGTGQKCPDRIARQLRLLLESIIMENWHRPPFSKAWAQAVQKVSKGQIGLQEALQELLRLLVDSLRREGATQF